MKVKSFWLASAASASPVSSMVRVPALVLVVLMTPTTLARDTCTVLPIQSIASPAQGADLERPHAGSERKDRTDLPTFIDAVGRGDDGGHLPPG